MTVSAVGDDLVDGGVSCPCSVLQVRADFVALFDGDSPAVSLIPFPQPLNSG